MSRFFLKLGIAPWCALSAAVLLPLAFSADSTLAQELKPVADGTLGAESSVVTPTNPQADRIDGGAIRGANLFHSFSQFSIGEGREAYFANPSGIENILSRVTGNDASRIFGKLGVLGNANLFLINPNGIIFGINASLDIRGSFVGTTANALAFGNQGFFSATNPNTPALLTVNPSAFFFNQIAAAPIQNNSVAPAGKTPAGGNAFGLRVPNGRSLLLLGGNVSMDGGQLNANGGRVELGGLASAGTVGLNVNGNNLSLSFPNGVALADVFLSNAASVYASGEGGGNIKVQGRRILLTEGSGIIADTLGSENGGGIFLRASQLIVRDGSFISSRTFGTGQGGNLTVSASDSVELIGTTPDGQFPSVLFTRTEDAGSAGKLTIETGRLLVQDGAQVVAGAGVRSTGQGGILQVTASDSVELSGQSVDNQISSGLYSQTEGVGTAGDLTITTGKLIVQNRANISTESLNDRSGGAAGDLTIATGKLIVQNGSYVSSDTDNEGQGGNLTVTASDSVEVIGTTPDGRKPSNLSSRGATGAGGNLTLETQRLVIRDGAQVGTGTFGKGNGGTLTVNASDSVELVGSSISSDPLLPSGLFTQTQDTGSAGDLKIDTKQLVVQDGARVSAGTVSQGNAGNIQIHATNSVDLSGVSPKGFSGGLFASTTGVGQGGSITVNSSTFRVADGAVVNALTTAEGNGGNITVNAKTFEADNGGQVLTTTRSSGRSGNIQLNVTDSVRLVGSDPTFTNRLAQFGRPRVSNQSPASGLFANTDVNSTGDGGNIFIDSIKLILTDGASVAVNSLGKGNAGSLKVRAGILTLDGRSSLSATTASTEGGNINLQVQDLLQMRHNSQISTSAGTAQAGGGGGNITINTPNGFLVAVPRENSDITANAYTGTGGRVDINAFGIYGIQPRQKPTSLSDITASSEFGVNGTVELNTPDIDLNSALINLPSVPVDTQLAQGCNSPNYAQSSFIITGRGGLPPNPKDILTPDAVQVDWVTLNPELDKNSTTNISTNPNPTTPASIVEATGWVFGPKGEVIFTAQAPTQHQNSWQTSPKCHEK